MDSHTLSSFALHRRSSFIHPALHHAGVLTQPSQASSSSCSHPPVRPAETAVLLEQTQRSSEFPAPCSAPPVPEIAPYPPSAPPPAPPSRAPSAPHAAPPSCPVRPRQPRNRPAPEPCSRAQSRQIRLYSPRSAKPSP